jgi:hypothetical protein
VILQSAIRNPQSAIRCSAIKRGTPFALKYLSTASATPSEIIRSYGVNEMQRVWSILWRVLKVTPVVGYVFVIAGIPDVLRRKGYVFGVLSIALDLMPVICLIKAVIEIFTGDLIPNKFEAQPAPQFEPAI